MTRLYFPSLAAGLKRRVRNKDSIGAVMLIVLGAGILGLATTYHLGTLGHMGSGFIPAVLGTLMILLGFAIGITAAAVPPPEVPAPDVTGADVGSARGGANAARPEWRGWLCILAAVAAFVALGHFGGLVPATFASVFLAALGDRQNSPRNAAALAGVISVFGIAVFHFGLRLQLPLFQWQ